MKFRGRQQLMTGLMLMQMFPAVLGIFMVVLVQDMGFPTWMWGILFFLPRAYEDRRAIVPIDQLEVGRPASRALTLAAAEMASSRRRGFVDVPGGGFPEVPLVARLCRFQGEIVWDHTKPDGQPRRMLDTSRALREFGWKSRIGFEEGLRETVTWFEENRP